MTAPRYQPLPHQRPALEFLMNGGSRAVLVWHRRSGKDLTAFNWTWAASQKRVGTYYYFLPTYSQGRKVIWLGKDESGLSNLSYIPDDLIARHNGRPHIHETDMRIHMANGSIIQIVGGDNIDSIVGTNPVGCVFSEYALMDPQVWRLMSPILRKNKGWAVFVYTPRGHNHGYDLYQNMMSRDGWFVDCQTIENTGLIDPKELDDDRASGIPEEIIQQEYYCSFSVTLEGSYFGQQMMAADSEGRILDFPYDPRNLVHTAWDFGINDSTSIWFIQTDGRTYRAIDFYENRSFGLPHYAKKLQELPYVYGVHLAPHDVMKRGDYGTQEIPTTLQETAYQLGINFTRIPRTPKLDQHHATHLAIPRTVFHATKCERGIEGLRGYEREWDTANKVHRNTPKHNWASHIADAFMTFACGIDLIGPEYAQEPYTQGSFHPRYYESYSGFDPRKTIPEPEKREYRDDYDDDQSLVMIAKGWRR